jgi:hypothetical protein
MLCYFKDVDVDIDLKNKNNLHMLYNPSKINKILLGEYNLIDDCRIQNMNKDIYTTYIYDLFLSEINNYFNSEVNLNIRKLIKKTLAKINFKIPKEFNEFEKILNTQNLLKSDKEKIIKIIKKGNIMSKKKMYIYILKTFNESYFDFDKISFNKLKKIKQKSSMTNELKNISKKIIKIVSNLKYDKGKYFNDLSNCSEKIDVFYCSGKKLILTKEIFNKIINKLADDLLNPYKKKWIFNPLFINRNIDFFKFKNYINEQIILEIL